MKALTMLSVALVVVALFHSQPTEAQKIKPGATKQSASQSRPATTDPRARSVYNKKKPTQAKQKHDVAAFNMTRAHSVKKQAGKDLQVAARELTRAQRAFDRAPPERKGAARRRLDAARMNHANRRLDLSDSRAAYRAARNSYRQANDQLHGQRSSSWASRLATWFKGFLPKRSFKGRRVEFAEHHLGRTGSGEPRPTVQPRGVLVTSERVSVELERRPMPLN